MRGVLLIVILSYKKPINAAGLPVKKGNQLVSFFLSYNLALTILCLSILDHIHHGSPEDPQGDTDQNALDEIIWKNDQSKYHPDDQTIDDPHADI